MVSHGDLTCKVCHYPGSDIRLLGCGCTFHAAPLSLVLDVHSQSQQDFAAFPSPNTIKGSICQTCRSGPVNGIYLYPLAFDDIDRAVALRKASPEGKGGVSGQNRRKSSQDDDDSGIHADATYLLLSDRKSSLSGSGMSDREQQRTGRWTDEEIAFVDYLVSAFDKGTLPLPHGIKLNEFLGDILICKSSRLTKKMKNAKLSTRSFALGSGLSKAIHNNYTLLSNLQEKFLMSIPSEPTQLELRFNLTKQWRTHFSNLCVQVGYPFLDGKDWVASLEEMERRASDAEEMIRRARRKRMGLALQTDGSSSANPSVFIAGVKADRVASQSQPILSSFDLVSDTPGISTSEARKLSTSEDGSDQQDDEDVFAMLDGFGDDGTDAQQSKRARARTFSEEFLQPENKKGRTFSEDFDAVLNDLIDQDQPTESLKPKIGPNHSCGPFLDAITMFMENRNLPFQHADVWVPSFLPRETAGPSKAVDTEQLRLFHAGYATRGDLDAQVSHALNEFGVYSDNFSFEPSHGLPGRVYSSGQIAWECNVDESDPKKFERAGGAKVYGIKTAVGIPLSTPLVGRIVVAMYSKDPVPQNMAVARDCAKELMRYSPEPKWKLVIEMNDEPKGSMVEFDGKQSKRNTGNEIGKLNIGISQTAQQKLPTQVVGCTSPNTAAKSDMDAEEQRIVTLLGEHMPLSDGSTGEPSSSAGTSGNLLPHFMSIRLLLLRPPSRRTAKENEMIDVLKNSFRAYSKDNRRSGAELAQLLAKDWVCLKTTFGGPASKQSEMPVRRHSSTDVALMKTHSQLMQGQFKQPSPRPLANPPGQFINPQNHQMGQNQMGAYRRTSMNALSSNNSAFSQGSQGMVQPQAVPSSQNLTHSPPPL